MTPERWQQVERLLHEVLAQRPADREALLEQRCNGDHELRQEVTSLLEAAASERADGFLTGQAMADAALLVGDEDADSLPGKSFGPYIIQRRLGAGGMGEVYLAEDVRLGRKVALKLLDSAFTKDSQWRTRFVREARLASGLDHPNICMVHEVGEAHDRQFIAMQYIEGHTLREILSETHLSLESLLSISLQVADALALAHQHGVVHRDIKSANIMVTPRGQVKVLDFGLAKSVEHAGDYDQTHLTLTGAVLGTPASMSPEQARGEHADHRSDIFSFGVVVYEMATGRSPFAGRSKADVISALLKDSPEPASGLNEEIPPRLSAMIDRMLAKAPAERHQSMPELIAELRQVVGEVGGLDRLFNSSDPSQGIVPLVPPRRTTGSVDSTESLVRSRISRQRNALFLSGGLLLVLLLAAGVYGLWSNNSKQNDHTGTITLPFAQESSKQLTTKGRVRWAVLSPDGKFYAYVLTEREEIKESLWLGQTDAGNDIQLRPADGVYNGLAFSPDGKTLYFSLRGESQSGLFKMPLLGGVADRLSDLSTNFSLSPNGKQIAFLRGKAKSTALVMANLDHTQEKELLNLPPDKNFSVNCFAWSPDGSIIAIAAISDSSKVSREIFTVNVADGEVQQLTTFDFSRVSNLIWQPNGQGLILVGTSKNETLRHLWQVDYPSGKARTLSRDTDGYGAALSLSADGNMLLAVQLKRESNLWIAPLEGLSTPRQITFSSINGVYGWEGFDCSPDGSIVFTAGVDRSVAIYAMNANGSNIRQITSSGFFDQKPRVTGDGKFIVFQSNRSGGNEIWSVKSDGSGLRQLTTGGGNTSPDATPDGKWVILTSTRDGKSSISRVSIEGGEVVQLTERESSEPAVSPDGKFIACIYRVDSASPAKLAIFKLEERIPIKLFDVPPSANFNDSLLWSADGNAITYRDRENGIWRQELSGGRPNKLAGLQQNDILRFAWSNDGKLLVLARGRSMSDAILFRMVK